MAWQAEVCDSELEMDENTQIVVEEPDFSLI